MISSFDETLKVSLSLVRTDVKLADTKLRDTLDWENVVGGL